VINIFLDANVFFAAVHSPQGGSGLVIQLAKQGKVGIYTVSHVLLEAERNIESKLGQKYLSAHYQNLIDVKPKIIALPILRPEDVEKFNQLVPIKDIPVLLGGLCGNIKWLVTLDKKHFLNNIKLVEKDFPFIIVNPGDFLKRSVKKLRNG
jgi:predicted nucleic acid-binding protein